MHISQHILLQHILNLVTSIKQEISANSRETRETLYQFLFANSQSVSSHFVAVHSWSVRCSRRLQKSIKQPYFKSSGSFKVIDVDTTEKLVTSACCNKHHATILTKDWPTTVK